MSESSAAELVAVVEMTDDGNEDHWAQTSWHARCAAVEAATAAGHDERELTVAWADVHTLVATAPDGRGFAAVLSQRPGGSLWGRARPPEADELARWRDR